jgi:hypothetical protein
VPRALRAFCCYGMPAGKAYPKGVLCRMLPLVYELPARPRF